MTSTSTCPDCGEQLTEHCHGTLIRHADGSVECTDLQCRVLDAGRHELVVVCALEIDCPCTAA
jgi:hypothetical protein